MPWPSLSVLNSIVGYPTLPLLEMSHVKTALFTTALSPTNIAFARHLLAQTKSTWRLAFTSTEANAAEVISDLDPARTIHLPTFLSSWPAILETFQNLYSWNDVHRIDLVIHDATVVSDSLPTIIDSVVPPSTADVSMNNTAGNASSNAIGSVENELPPIAPNLDVWEHNITSTLFVLKLFVFAARRTQAELLKQSPFTAPSGVLGQSLSNGFHPKMLILGSLAGIYASTAHPQHTASQQALVGLVRSVGGQLLSNDDIGVNMALVPPMNNENSISFPSQGATAVPEEFQTPTTTLIRAFDELTDEKGEVRPDSLSNGLNQIVKSGCVVECASHRVIYHEQANFTWEGGRWWSEQGQTQF